MWTFKKSGMKHFTDIWPISIRLILEQELMARDKERHFDFCNLILNKKMKVLHFSVTFYGPTNVCLQDRVSVNTHYLLIL